MHVLLKSQSKLCRYADLKKCLMLGKGGGCQILGEGCYLMLGTWGVGGKVRFKYVFVILYHLQSTKWALNWSSYIASNLSDIKHVFKLFLSITNQLVGWVGGHIQAGRLG